MNPSVLSAPVASASAVSPSSTAALNNALSNSLTNLEFSDLMQIWGDSSEDSAASTSASSSILTSSTASQASGAAAPVLAPPVPESSSTQRLHYNHDTRDLSTSEAARDQAKYDLQLSNAAAYLRSLGETLAANQAGSIDVTAI